MPHIDLDYSDSLVGSVDVPALMAELHPLVVDRVRSVGVGKTFARSAPSYVDGAAAPFVHVAVGLLPGRPQAMKDTLSEDVLALLDKHLSGVPDVTYSVEVRDLDASYRLYPTH
ncbi:5-carboxymethyl-2-hydroxymuconate Delta-isomerase [Streptomyces sp. VRA16 Mangrove soil]|uniref:5-carboxymethyl-2-hydroxymuconate Delta-isomerase n=1 Tax=Streptomyces sp. VRA16 Mangrove soil TaxID=2817434 RepID=UPI001A9DF67A|nr:5-carboxymethyl-2-hydroxymuconate delta isomerase [Streptomyces sp. VRA16 Mangrove soil]MBO1333296.1 5-carboxymethyl-2-hydroxymuconate delta isomerase [Streptomyces sp. VRA16 Mangrove soil]